MPRNDDEFNDSYDDDDFDEYDDLQDEPTQECPYCGCEVLEVLLQCPKCGNYFSKEDVAQTGPKTWIKIVILLCLAGFFIGMLF